MDIDTLKLMYERFNARDIDGVLPLLADDVVWANGMDGGHVHGREAVREYWTHQFSIVRAQVLPIGFERIAENSIVVRVQQSIRDLSGQPVEQTHKLTDKIVGHAFRFEGGKIVRFDIRDVS